MKYLTALLNALKCLFLSINPIGWPFGPRRNSEFVATQKPYWYKVEYVPEPEVADVKFEMNALGTQPVKYETIELPEDKTREEIAKEVAASIDESNLNLSYAIKEWVDLHESCPCCEDTVPELDPVAEDYIGEKIYHVGDSYFASYVNDEGTLVLKDIDTFTAEDFEPAPKAKKKGKKNAKSKPVKSKPRSKGRKKRT